MNRATAVLLACLATTQLHAQSLSTVPLSTALSEPPAGTNTVIVIRAGDLRDQTVVLEINGSKVAELKSNQSYTGVYSPGRLYFTFADRPTTLEAYAIPNEEHAYELQIVASKPPKGSVFGAAQPVLVLKERKTTIAGYLPPQQTRPPPPPEALAVEVSEQTSPANVKFVLVGAGDHSFPVTINGRRIPAVGPGVTYSAVYTPGRIEIVASGPRFEVTARAVCLPNEECVFEVASPPTPTRYKFGFFGFREIPDMVKGPDPTVALKRRAVMFAAPPAQPKTD